MRAKVWIALGTIYVVWGSTFLAIAVVVRDLPPFLSMSLRHLVAGSLLFGWVMVRHRNRDPIGWRQWRAAFVFGGALFLGGHGLLAWAQQDVPSGIAALLVGTIPLWFAILARIFMGERLGGRALAGLVLGFAGLALLVDPSGQEGAEPIGALAMVVGALAWSAGSIYSQRSALPKDTLLGAAMGMLAGGALLAVVGYASGERLHVGEVSARSWIALGFLVVFGSIVAYSSYVWLLKVAPTELVGTYAYVNPVIAVLLGALVLDEAITAWVLLAGAAIVVSVVLIVRAQTAPQAESEPLELEEEGATLAA